MTEHRVATLVLAVVALSAPIADASPLSEALARAKPSDIEALRPQRDVPAARCTLGAIYAKRGDLTRAALYLTDCDALDLPDDIGTQIRKHARETRKKLNDSDLATLEIASSPEGLAVETDALAGEPLVTPTTLWVKPGTYEVRTTHEGQAFKVSVVTRTHSRSVAFLDTRVGKPTKPVRKDQQVDFSDEGGTTQNSGPPPDVKRPSLVPDRYAGKMAGGGQTLDDPLATRRPGRELERSWSIGARLGGGIFDDGELPMRPGLAVAATGRLRIGSHVFAIARLDWSNRAGESTSSVPVVGISAGAGLYVATNIAVLAQLRGDLRFVEMGQRADAPVHRFGAGVAAGVEVQLPSTPLTAGARFEQGVTELATDGARDRALLVELGFDWP